MEALSEDLANSFSKFQDRYCFMTFESELTIKLKSKSQFVVTSSDIR